MKLTKTQHDLASYWIMEAMATTSKEDEKTVIEHIEKDVSMMTDKECIAELEKELS